MIFLGYLIGAEDELFRVAFQRVHFQKSFQRMRLKKTKHTDQVLLQDMGQ